jgi:hypothetical protein
MYFLRLAEQGKPDSDHAPLARGFRQYPNLGRRRRIDELARRRNDAAMNIALIEEAVERGVPFKLKVAGGDEFLVPHPDYIFLPPKSGFMRTYVMVHNDKGYASLLPLLTITSLTFKVDSGKKR